MAGMDHHSHSGSHHTEHEKHLPHHGHHLNPRHHTGLIKFKLGIAILSWMQIIGGMLILNFEAICEWKQVARGQFLGKPIACARQKSLLSARLIPLRGMAISTGSVLYITNASTNETLHGTEFAGIYVGIFAQITGGMGLVSVKKHGVTHFFRSCFHIAHVVLTVFLALQAFGMCCASGAMLVFLVAGWDTILAFVNRVSKSAELNLAVGTTTTVIPTTELPPLIAAEIAQDRHVIMGLRSTLFVLYFLELTSAIIASCFSCCNYCSCWNTETAKELPVSREITVTTMGFDERHGATHGRIEAVKKERVVSVVPLGETDHNKGPEKSSHDRKHRRDRSSHKEDSAKYH